MAYRLRYSDYASNGEGPPNPEAWVGPPGPQGPPGPPGVAQALQSSLVLNLSGPTVSGLLLVNNRTLFVIKLQSLTNVLGNYTLQLLNGSGGAVLYEATGINSTTFNDVAGAYIESSTDVYVKLTQIDPVALTATILMRYLDVT